ncbi:hypothetical protein Tco_0558080 [Tanacetum coccineum]
MAMKSTGNDIDLNHLWCSLCKTQPDSHAHLFLECPYSSQVWFGVMNRAEIQFASDKWSDIMAWLLPISKRNNVEKIVVWLILAAVSYFVWQERNNRVHGKDERNFDQLSKITADTIRLKLAVLIWRQVETELKLEEKYRELCDEVSNFVKESEDVVHELERLSGNHVVKETVRLLRRRQKRDLYKMTRLQMMVNESHLSVREKHTFQLIQNGDFYYEIEDSETKLMKETPYELFEDDQKMKLGKNNEAKMTLYNALPLKNCQIDLLTQEYENFSITNEETIVSGFTRFNTIVTSLKSLDPDYPSKNHVRKFLHALPVKWRAKVTTIEEAKDLATLPLDELIENLKVYEMVLDNDGVGSMTTKEKVKSLALKAKVTREQTSDDSDSQGESDTDIDEEEEAKAFNLLARNFRKEGHFASECRKPKENKAFVRGAWSDSEDGNEHQNDATCLMAIDSHEVVSKPSSSNIDLNIIDLRKENKELLKFNKDFTKTFEKLLKVKRVLVDKNSKLSSKINDLEIKVKKLVNDKEVVEPCQKFVELTQEVDSLKSNVSKLQDEALSFSKFKESNIALDDMLIHQKSSQDKEGLGFSKNDKITSSSPNKQLVFVKESQKETPSKIFVKPIVLETHFSNTRGSQAPITRVETRHN